MKTALKLVLLGLKCAAAAVSLLLLLVIFIELREKYNYYYGFDQHGWKAAGNALREFSNGRDPANARESMASDVVAHYLTPGMSRQAVIDLLGPPDWQDSPTDSTLANYLPRMQYYIWTASSRVGSLTIVLTPRGRIVRYDLEER
jgi:hypothetical protein